AATATHFSVSAPATATAGNPVSVTVTAEDQFGNVATSYRGTVQFTTSDTGSGVSVPGDYPFVAADNRTPTFTNRVTFATLGNQTITATDTGSSSITGSATVDVRSSSGGVATHFSISVPTSATAGAPFSVIVTALDSLGDTAASYLGTVHFTIT